MYFDHLPPLITSSYSAPTSSGPLLQRKPPLSTFMYFFKSHWVALGVLTLACEGLFFGTWAITHSCATKKND